VVLEGTDPGRFAVDGKTSASRELFVDQILAGVVSRPVPGRPPDWLDYATLQPELVPFSIPKEPGQP